VIGSILQIYHRIPMITTIITKMIMICVMVSIYLKDINGPYLGTTRLGDYVKLSRSPEENWRNNTLRYSSTMEVKLISECLERNYYLLFSSFVISTCVPIEAGAFLLVTVDVNEAEIEAEELTSLREFYNILTLVAGSELEYDLLKQTTKLIN
jgi:hypothetical protein